MLNIVLQKLKLRYYVPKMQILNNIIIVVISFLIGRYLFPSIVNGVKVLNIAFVIAILMADFVIGDFGLYYYSLKARKNKYNLIDSLPVDTREKIVAAYIYSVISMLVTFLLINAVLVLLPDYETLNLEFIINIIPYILIGIGLIIPVGFALKNGRFFLNGIFFLSLALIIEYKIRIKYIGIASIVILISSILFSLKYYGDRRVNTFYL